MAEVDNLHSAKRKYLANIMAWNLAELAEAETGYGHQQSVTSQNTTKFIMYERKFNCCFVLWSALHKLANDQMKFMTHATHGGKVAGNHWRRVIYTVDW